ncbi:PREDICTED: adenosine kinase 2-like [Camelina sativa]|uniref:Adenosine kinase n=1 Tax=Camelina sativa TaxID=90675 RepID=A0ABM1QLY3_CAMSA|nr:PREDICTED: adenosine kinase 2-like [Camelina sativa]
MKVATTAGVNVHSFGDESKPTRTCRVCVLGGERSLIANLSAASCYKVEHLHKHEYWALVGNAKFYYIDGFFVTIYHHNPFSWYVNMQLLTTS